MVDGRDSRKGGASGQESWDRSAGTAKSCCGAQCRRATKAMMTAASRGRKCQTPCSWGRISEISFLQRSKVYLPDSGALALASGKSWRSASRGGKRRDGLSFARRRQHRSPRSARVSTRLQSEEARYLPGSALRWDLVATEVRRPRWPHQLKLQRLVRRLPSARP